ncbi:MAG: Rrf2 family transcriptional regulator [Spirochaetaceae bacterium]|jgi:Rrf2 family protein|nr:Rrf2 family transcriptional regulator [Spirochaetaceae bacterium]
MKISTRGRYGMRLLIDLAGQKNNECVTLASIAARQKISVRYLEQVAIILRRAGIIRSVKGASGGYTLAESSNEIVVGDILRVLEGDMLIIDPPPAEKKENPIQACVRRVVFDPLNKRIADIIDNTTLAAYAGPENSDKAYMYFI